MTHAPRASKLLFSVQSSYGFISHSFSLLYRNISESLDIFLDIPQNNFFFTKEIANTAFNDCSSDVPRFEQLQIYLIKPFLGEGVTRLTPPQKLGPTGRNVTKWIYFFSYVPPLPPEPKAWIYSCDIRF